ncbi:MAG: BON domain-containing protein [Methylophilaceae bacterium]|jgi:hyperosmotically inducible protein|nr:BON domain-containing protein [Methyloradius sp.]
MFKKIDKKLQLATCVAAVMVVLSFQETAIGASSTTGNTDAPANSAFEKLDANHDGKLNIEEVAPDKDLTENFVKVDANQDGAIQVDEFNSYKSANDQKQIVAFLDDSALTAKIKAELVKDNGIKGLNISVETHKGEVILSGFVENNIQIRRAIDIATSVQGVQSVKNGLLIKG